MRLFFAILLPDEVREELRRVQATAREVIGREGLRWEDAGKFHITVRFLGEVAPERLEDVKEAGREAALAFAPFTLALSSMGAFPEGRQPRVLWIGAENGLPEYARLAEYLNSALSARSFAAETRRAYPHVTIARVKTAAGSKAAARALALKNLKKPDKKGVFFVYNIVLMESELRPEGSVYTIVETFTLTAL